MKKIAGKFVNDIVKPVCKICGGILTLCFIFSACQVIVDGQWNMTISDTIFIGIVNGILYDYTEG